MESAVTQILLEHCRRYPDLLPQDLIKFLFQSAFGCEHLIQDASAAAGFIRQEAESCRPHEGPLVEPLAGPYCRVHLDYVRQGLDPGTLARLFALSAQPKDRAAGLENLLLAAQTLARQGLLPFSQEAWDRAAAEWRAAGFPACHHSPEFRGRYHPAYRLIRREYSLFLPLFAAIDRLSREKSRLLVAIDGGCASGKTTLAQLLEQVYHCPVFHMDDFFLRPEQRTPERLAEPGGNVDRERFFQEVLAPLRQGRPVTFRRFDCGSAGLLPPVTLQPGALNLIEGSYSLHPALFDQYDLTVFLQIDPALQRRRVLKRNPESAQQFFQRWIPMEQRYAEILRPQDRCHLRLTVDS